MQSTASQFSLISTGGILLAGLLLLTTSRLEYCGRPEVSRSSIGAVTIADARTPTLAPPPRVVFVRIEADRSELEIGWLED